MSSSGSFKKYSAAKIGVDTLENEPPIMCSIFKLRNLIFHTCIQSTVVSLSCSKHWSDTADCECYGVTAHQTTKSNSALQISTTRWCVFQSLPPQQSTRCLPRLLFCTQFVIRYISLFIFRYRYFLSSFRLRDNLSLSGSIRIASSTIW